MHVDRPDPAAATSASHGIGTRILRDLCAVAAADGMTINLGVDRGATTRAADALHRSWASG